MASNGNGMPRAEPIWIALGIVVLAVATALGPRRRRVFIEALEDLTTEHEARGRVIAFGPGSARSAHLSRSIRVAAVYTRRLVEHVKAVLT